MTPTVLQVFLVHVKFTLLVNTGPTGNFHSNIGPTCIGNFNSSIGPTGNFNSSILYYQLHFSYFLVYVSTVLLQNDV